MTSYLYSLLLHVCLVVFIVIVVDTSSKQRKNKPQTVKFKVIENPVLREQQTKAIVPPVAKEPKKAKPPKKIVKKKIKKKRKKARKVFGVSKKSITSKSVSAPAVKRGNTIATEVDQKKLLKDDQEELPIPKAEYLVTEMPVVISAAKIAYPKGMQLEGTVVLNVLVDENGRVRDAMIVEGLAAEMDAAALQAIKKYRFSPAKIDDVAVAVRIRYAVKFVLENN